MTTEDDEVWTSLTEIAAKCDHGLIARNTGCRPITIRIDLTHAPCKRCGFDGIAYVEVLPDVEGCVKVKPACATCGDRKLLFEGTVEEIHCPDCCRCEDCVFIDPEKAT